MQENILLRNIPQELKMNGLWCGWKLTDKGKEPFNLSSGLHAKSNDENTFSSYPVLLNNLHKFLKYDEEKQVGGIGLGIFRGYSAIDIDHCVEDGVISEMAKDIIDYCDSYTEYSPSGTGIRIIFKTQTKINKNEFYINNHKLGLEVYISNNTNKFVSITGNKISGDVINEIDLSYVLNKYMRKGQFDIDKIIKKDARLKELWNKKAPGSHADESESDMALCCKLAFYLKNNIVEIKRYFEMSPYFKSKDEAHINKWNNGYGLSTINSALNYIDKPENKIAVTTRKYDLTDTGNAHRFVDMFGEGIRWNVDNKCWMIWNGIYWQYDVQEYIKNYVEILAEKMSLEANEIEDMTQRLRAIKNIEDIYNTSGKEALLKEARHIQGIPLLNSMLDTQQYLICTENGTINLNTGEVEENNKDNLISQSTMCGISHEKPKLFLKTINDMFEGNKELIHYFHKAIGYSMSDLCSEQCMFILHSDGNSGKSLIMDVFRTILNSYAITSSSELITDNKYGRVDKEEIARLKGKRLVIIDEIEQGDKGNERLIKDLTSGLTPMVGRHLYASSFEFAFRGKIRLITNYDFIIRGTDKGIWRRIKKIPVFADFTGREDKFLREKLLKEAPEILGWMLEGFKLYMEEGLEEPKIMSDAIKEYKEEMDIVQQWINETCDVKPSYFEKANTLYDNFRIFCQRRDIKTNQTVFGRNLGKKFKKYNSGSGIVYIGLRLKTEANDLAKRVSYEQVNVSEDI